MADGRQGAMDAIPQIPEGPLRSAGHLKGGQASAKAHLHLYRGCGHAERCAAVDRTISHALSRIAGGWGAFKGI